MGKFSTFIFTANTIDGKILEFPQIFYLRCNLVTPLGCDIVRQYNGNECIVARKVFQVMYQGQLLGSSQFKDLSSFLLYRNNQCNPVANCDIIYNGCNLVYNGCSLAYTK